MVREPATPIIGEKITVKSGLAPGFKQQNTKLLIFLWFFCGIFATFCQILVDKSAQKQYNVSMESTKKFRKKRSDRTHIVYQLEHGDDFYIGVTAKTESTPLKSVKTRFNKHVYRSRSEDKSWLLYEKLRKTACEGWTLSILAVIRGKSEAHQYERELIRNHLPNLNTDTRGA